MPIALRRQRLWNENTQPASASVEDVLISVGLHARSGWSQYREHYTSASVAFFDILVPIYWTGNILLSGLPKHYFNLRLYLCY